MSIVVIIIICVVCLAAVAVLFWIADRNAKERKQNNTENKVKPETAVTSGSVADTPNVRAGVGGVGEEFEIEENQYGLADAIEALIEEDKKNTQVETEKKQERVMRSRLSNTGRMRTYFEKKHGARQMNVPYDCSCCGNDNEKPDDPEKYDLSQLSQDDINRLLALQQVFDKK